MTAVGLKIFADEEEMLYLPTPSIFSEAEKGQYAVNGDSASCIPICSVVFEGSEGGCDQLGADDFILGEDFAMKAKSATMKRRKSLLLMKNVNIPSYLCRPGNTLQPSVPAVSSFSNPCQKITCISLPTPPELDWWDVQDTTRSTVWEDLDGASGRAISELPDRGVSALPSFSPPPSDLIRRGEIIGNGLRRKTLNFEEEEIFQAMKAQNIQDIQDWHTAGAKERVQSQTFSRSF